MPTLHHMVTFAFKASWHRILWTVHGGQLCVVCEAGDSLRILGPIQGPSSRPGNRPSALAVSRVLECAAADQN